MTTITGAGYDRIDGPEKVTGSARYSADVHLEGLLHAVFATSTIANGRISRIDVSRAERVAGVVAVFTYETMPRLAVPPLYAFAKQTGMTFAFLQDDRILYAGQPIAMVVANTREQAVGAAELIDVEYADEPPVATLADAASNAYELQRLYGLLPASYTRGNIEDGLRQADVCVTATYSSPGYRHHPIGSACHLAAQAMVRRLISMSVGNPFSPLHGADPDSITARDARLVHPDGRTDTFTDILNRAALPNLDVMAEWDPASGTAIAGGTERHIPLRLNSAFSHGAWFVIVAVDPDFGIVRVRRLAGVFAAGRILNEKTAISQIRGGAIMGIGQALLEGTTTDRSTARILNPGLNEYLIPTHADVPPIDVAFVPEHDEEINVLGVKGIGELPISGVAPAIAGAVYHATGRRIRNLPIRPEMLA